MRLSLGKRGMRTLVASIMVVTFALRELIPTGFIPASRPFSIEICWEDFPAEVLAHGSLRIRTPSAQALRRLFDSNVLHDN